jgi:anti-sigma regulatory factor (Ser/Thr protein kinase)
MKQHIVVNINEASNVGELRRVVIDLAKGLSFDEERTGRLAIIANEMSTNILKHAGCSGKVAIRKPVQKDIYGIELIAIDRGVGIKNMGFALRDGFSTAGSMGSGLGAIKRLSDDFDIYSQAGKGTIVFSQVWKESNSLGLFQSVDKVNYGVFSLPKSGEGVCGDQWHVEKTRNGILCFVSDGLGHGEGAAQASRQALRVFKDNTALSLEDLMLKLHNGLTGTRGAAISLAEINFNKNLLSYIGVGNVSGRLFNKDKTQSCISIEGILGANLRKVQSFSYKLTEDSVFVMYTDGFSTNIILDNYPGILNKKPGIIAALIFRDFSRGNDDTAVLVLKNSKCR